MNKDEAIKQIEQLGKYKIFIDEPISKSAVLNIISQIDTKPKQIVPKVAVEFYETYKDEGLSFEEWFDDFYSEKEEENFPRLKELAKWLYGNRKEVNRQHELALATLIINGLDAVEVEKEKKYTVELFNGQPLVEVNNVLYFSSDLVAPNACVSKDKLELAGFGWVFDCNGVKVLEVD